MVIQPLSHALAPMQIKQVNLIYVPLEDRLLMRINTMDKATMGFWLTRALTTRLLAALRESEAKVLEGGDRARFVGVTDEELAQLNRQSRTAQADFTAAWDEYANSHPLGEAPVLITDLKLPNGPGKDAPLVLQCANGMMLTMTLNDVLLHSLLSLVERFAGEAGWGLGLGEGAVAPLAPEAGQHLH